MFLQDQFLLLIYCLWIILSNLSNIVNYRSIIYPTSLIQFKIIKQNYTHINIVPVSLESYFERKHISNTITKIQGKIDALISISLLLKRSVSKINNNLAHVPRCSLIQLIKIFPTLKSVTTSYWYPYRAINNEYYY